MGRLEAVGIIEWEEGPRQWQRELGGVFLPSAVLPKNSLYRGGEGQGCIQAIWRAV